MKTKVRANARKKKFASEWFELAGICVGRALDARDRAREWNAAYRRKKDPRLGQHAYEQNMRWRRIELNHMKQARAFAERGRQSEKSERTKR
jgi:hypothetical protein